jgi:hypothetical protein
MQLTSVCIAQVGRGGPIADDTDAEMTGAESERASVKVPALLMSIMACLLWIDVPSPNQAGSALCQNLSDVL